jgi:hypothetical protein
LTADRTSAGPPDGAALALPSAAAAFRQLVVATRPEASDTPDAGARSVDDGAEVEEGKGEESPAEIGVPSVAPQIAAPGEGLVQKGPALGDGSSDDVAPLGVALPQGLPTPPMVGSSAEIAATLPSSELAVDRTPRRPATADPDVPRDPPRGPTADTMGQGEALLTHSALARPKASDVSLPADGSVGAPSSASKLSEIQAIALPAASWVPDKGGRGIDRAERRSEHSTPLAAPASAPGAEPKTPPGILHTVGATAMGTTAASAPVDRSLPGLASRDPGAMPNVIVEPRTLTPTADPAVPPSPIPPPFAAASPAEGVVAAVLPVAVAVAAPTEMTPVRLPDPTATVSQLPARLSEAVDALRLQVHGKATPTGASTVIEMAPADLGRIRLQIDSSADGLRLAISVDRAETADIVRRHLEVLQRSVIGESVSIDRVQVHVQNQGAGSGQTMGGEGSFRAQADGSPQDRSPSGQHHHARTEPEATDAAAAPPAPPDDAPPLRRLDIRL